MPLCGEKCRSKSLSSPASCHPADSWCLCHNSKWRSDLEECFSSDCSAADLTTSLVANQEFCSNLNQTSTKPALSLPPSNPTPNNLSHNTSRNESIVVAAASRLNVTQPIHPPFKNQTLSPDSPFKSCSAALFINDSFLYPILISLGLCFLLTS